ncbi:MAG: hypothetical protein WAqPseu_02630 [Shewanella algae]
MILKLGCSEGFIATSSLAEGDTRETGLDYLLDNGLCIYKAESKSIWPGTASVTYSPIWLYKGKWQGLYDLDGKKVNGINAYLTEPGEVYGTPKRLKANTELSFQGSIPNGKGFVISNDVALALLEENPKNSDVIYPYLIGKELNIHPTHKPSQWIINFHDWPLSRETSPVGYSGPCAEDYPACLNIVREQVYPERTRLKENGEFKLRKPLPQKWWIYADKRPKLYTKLQSLSWALGIAAQATKHVAFAQVKGKCVYSHALSLIVTDNYGIAGLLQSSIHEVWARQYAGNNLLLLRYSPTDVFDTFAFPEVDSSLVSIGREYFKLRERLLIENKVGLTAIYNKFHDPNECDEEIQSFRELQIELDRSVVAAYGWGDLSLNHGFHEAKQGVCFTVSEDDRLKILQRLLKLNHERYEQEEITGKHSKAKITKQVKSQSQTKKTRIIKSDDNIQSGFDFGRVDE